MHRPLALCLLVAGCASAPAHVTSHSENAVAGSSLRGMNIDPRFGEPGEAAHPTAATLRELGVTMVRFTFKVPDGDLDAAFAFYDQELASYGSDLTALMILTGETLEGATPNTLGDDYIRAFADRAGAMAAHYGTTIR